MIEKRELKYKKFLFSKIKAICLSFIGVIFTASMLYYLVSYTEELQNIEIGMDAHFIYYGWFNMILLGVFLIIFSLTFIVVILELKPLITGKFYIVRVPCLYIFEESHSFKEEGKLKLGFNGYNILVSNDYRKDTYIGSEYYVFFDSKGKLMHGGVVNRF